MLYLFFAILSVSYAQNTCPSGTTLTSSSDVQCDADACVGCIFDLNGIEKLECSGKRACEDAEGSIIADKDFQLICGDDDSCASEQCTTTITIECDGESIKGITCGGERSCAGQTFVIDGGVNGCQLEKIECGGDDACMDTTFELINTVITSEFTCGAGFAGSCQGLACVGSARCPSGSSALPACTTTTTTSVSTTTTSPSTTDLMTTDETTTTDATTTDATTTGATSTPVTSSTTTTSTSSTSTSSTTSTTSTTSAASTTAVSNALCPPGTTLTSNSDVQCDEDACVGCIFDLNGIEKLECTGKRACEDAEGSIIADKDFQLICGDDDSCASEQCTTTITIECDGESIKGITCGGKRSCAGQTFVIDGGVNGCQLEKIECDGDDACMDATFELINTVITSEFKCGAGFAGSCEGLACVGSALCPSGSSALPACASTTTTTLTTTSTTEITTTDSEDDVMSTFISTVDVIISTLMSGIDISDTTSETESAESAESVEESSESHEISASTTQNAESESEPEPEPESPESVESAPQEESSPESVELVSFSADEISSGEDVVAPSSNNAMHCNIFYAVLVCICAVVMF